MEKALTSEKHISQIFEREAEELRQELVVLRQQWKASCNESQRLRDKVSSLQEQLSITEEKSSEECEDQSELSKESEPTPTRNVSPVKGDDFAAGDSSVCSISSDQFVALEEELVILKERYAQLNDEKLCLNKSYDAMREKYNAIVNQSHNTLFFYVAPLVLMVLYLLISSMFS